MKIRICKICKTEFNSYSFGQPRCYKCENTRLKEKTKNYKPLKAKRNLEQEAINKQVRERDSKLPCISCGKKTKLEAGHYIAVSKSQKLRYDLRNIHGQCMMCNRFLLGNVKAYRTGLINRYGLSFVEDLEKEHKHFT